MIFTILVCTDSEGGISKNGAIPWKIMEDYNFFRDITTNKIDNKPNIIIMGRNTFERMKIIKNNINIIISTTLTNMADISCTPTERVYIFKTIEEAINFISTIEIYNEIYVCGGKKIYDYFIDRGTNGNTNLLWTCLDRSYSCDNKININGLYNLLLSHRYFPNLYECDDILNDFTVTAKFYRQEYHMTNLEEQSYLNLMNSIITKGTYTKCRNGHTYSKFGDILRFNLKSFPLLTTKKIFFKGIFEELMYFIKGDTNTKHLLEKDVRIWEKNTTKEFIDKCNLPYEEYDMGPMYGFQLRHFNAKYYGMEESYDGKGFDQLDYVLNELKTNPASRRILMTTYNPAQAGEGVLFPCHGISIQFNTEHINNNLYKINISQNQRSCDYFLGVPFNIASYALLNYMICHVLNNDPLCEFMYEPGELVMFLGDHHIYKEHLVQARRQIMRVPRKFPKLSFRRNVTNIEDFMLEDIEITGYESYPGIPAEMIA